MASATNLKTAEFPSPSAMSNSANRSGLDLNRVKDTGNQDKKNEVATFRPTEEGNPKLSDISAIKYKSRSPTPSVSSQFSMKNLNMDQLYDKDPNFDPDEHKMKYHTPSKRPLDTPDDQRNKIKQESKLYKGPVANQGKDSGVLLTPEKQKEAPEDEQLKLDLLTLRGEIKLLKQRIGQIETQRGDMHDSDFRQETPQKTLLRNPLNLAGTPEASTKRGHYPSTDVSLRQSRVQPLPSNRRSSPEVENPLNLTAQQSQKFQTPQPHRTPQTEQLSSTGKGSLLRTSERGDQTRYYQPQREKFEDPETLPSPKLHLRTQSSNLNPTAGPSSHHYQSPLDNRDGSSKGNQQSQAQHERQRPDHSSPRSSSTGRHSARSNYSSMTNFPPYYKKEALYRPKYNKSAAQNPKAGENSLSSIRAGTSEPKIIPSTKITASHQNQTSPLTYANAVRPFSPSMPSYYCNRVQPYQAVTSENLPIQRQSSPSIKQNTIPARGMSPSQSNMSNQLSNIMDFYATQMDTLRNTILKQSQTISRQSDQIGDYEQNLGRHKNKVAELQDKLRDQLHTNDRNFSHLRNQYDQAMNELGGYKANIENLSSRIAREQVMRANQQMNQMLNHEVNSLKIDLRSQRSLIDELNSAKSNLDRQIQDLERNFQDEVHKGVEPARREQLYSAIDKHRYQYDTISQMNQAIIESCERTKRDLDKIRSSTHQTSLSAGRNLSETQALNYHSSPRSYSRLVDSKNPAGSSLLSDDRKGDFKERTHPHHKFEQSHHNSGLDLDNEQSEYQNPDYQKNGARDRRNLDANLSTRRAQHPHEEIQEPKFDRKKSATERDFYPDAGLDKLLRKKRSIENAILSLPETSKLSFHKRAKTQLERDLEDVELQIDGARTQSRRTHNY